MQKGIIQLDTPDKIKSALEMKQGEMPMPRKLKVKHLGEAPILHPKLDTAFSFSIPELPGLTFIGTTKNQARQNMIAELTRKFPQGFSLEYNPPV